MRAVDMLGRQQIAGVPTAIGELFKNAHDAYASEVHADLIRQLDLMVIRDDGSGMTRDEFVDRWLTLGTDSKLRTQRKPRGLARRPTLGEKGIGRLAIALLGPQVLVVTRPRSGKRGGELTLALINWRLFEIPGVSLDEIEIPVHTLKADVVPTSDAIGKLVGESISGLERLQVGSSGIEFLDTVRKELALFAPDLPILAEYLGTPSLLTGNGTRFIIHPISDALRLSLEARADGRVSDLHKLLIGFGNTMVPRQ